MKKIHAIVSIMLCLCLLAGCAGTPVIYHTTCDCSTDTSDPADNSTPAPEGALKTGIAITAGAKESKDAGEKDGEGKYDVTMVAVLVDDAGIIRDCRIDGIAGTVKFDATGKITSDLTAAVKTKNELGKDYGMVAYGGAKAEWDAQAAALAKFAIGKTAKELREGAVDETGKAPAGSDLASSATIYLGGYVAAIEKAVANAKHLGANSGDSLRLAAVADIKGSKDAGEKNGTTQLEVTATAMTMQGETITSCTLDAVQAKVDFDATGKITSDLTVAIKTKNELGKEYGMVAYGKAIAEWDAQAAAFAQYVTGKTAAQVAGIAVSETTAPTEADLKASVTIAIGGFQALIQKAAK